MVTWDLGAHGNGGPLALPHAVEDSKLVGEYVLVLVVLVSPANPGAATQGIVHLKTVGVHGVHGVRVLQRVVVGSAQEREPVRGVGVLDRGLKDRAVTPEPVPPLAQVGGAHGASGHRVLPHVEEG